MSDQLGIVQIETTGRCQKTCRFCPTGNGQRTRAAGRIQVSLFKSVVDQAWDMGVRIIVPFGNDEPFLDTRMFVFLDYLREKGMDVYLNSNMELLTPDKADRLITYPNIREVTMSLHAATPETYAYVVGGDYAKTLANARYLAKIAPFPVRHYMLQYEDNMQDAEAFRREWGDKASITPAFFNWGGSINSAYSEQFQKPPHPCERVLSQVYVLWDGTVALCCMDVDGAVPLGNLNDEPLQLVWDRNQPMRDKHHEHRFSELKLCATCTMNRY